MYIENAFKVSADWWRYIVGIIIIFIFTQIGSIPFIIAIISKAGLKATASLEESNMMTVLEDSNLTFFYFLLPFAFGLLGLCIVVKYLHRQSFLSLTTSRSKVDISRLLTSFLCISLITFLNIAFSHLFSPEEYVFNFDFSPFIILFLIAIVFIPIQTSFEEYVFRGYLMQGIANAARMKKTLYYFLITLFCIISFLIFIYNEFTTNETINFLLNISLFLLYRYLIIKLFDYSSFSTRFIQSDLYEILYKLLRRNSTPLFITSFAFGLLHFWNPEVSKLGYLILVHYVATGLFLGIITLMDDGMELALGFHAGNNLLIALLVTADWTVFQTNSVLKYIAEPEVIYSTIISVLVIYPLLLIYFSKKYKWSNWREKLFGKIN